ncbi:helix-turn-helix transcriptional regulator [Streptomyces sp. TRM 70351]|uniref:helix-turn-helix domain-containing protein n=1 Tax=Streptomyces sp. TRM 70351 TaxID=3116552 RepID=UPI002E7BFF8E|nr:helix-turn-helix transcriptional regulator [Streptomyces sp. TRM 70351]MEE1931263.1 helix-turn-helix transcriptional regulator [Streptomyces sp. TRM 70351]
MAEDAIVRSEDFLDRASSENASAEELLQKAAGLHALFEDVIATLVVRQRSEGKPLDELAVILERSADRLRKKYPPQDIDRTITKRSRPRRPASKLPSPTEPPDPPDPQPLQRLPRQRLASALTRAWQISGLTQAVLADRMGIDPSYVSRLLSGERDASWKHVKLICDVCQADTALMQSLWDAANGDGVPRPSDNPARDLRTYLKALLYAAGSPSSETVLASAQHTISATALHLALEGPGVPPRAVVKQLAVTLQSQPDTALALWSRAHGHTETCSVSAGAFG